MLSGTLSEDPNCLSALPVQVVSFALQGRMCLLAPAASFSVAICPTCFAVLLVKCAHIGVRVAADHRSVVPLQHDEVQPVGERELGHPALQPRPCIASICSIKALTRAAKLASMFDSDTDSVILSAAACTGLQGAPGGICAWAAGAAVTGEADTAAADAALPTSRSLLDSCGLASHSFWLPPEAARAVQRCRLCREDACDRRMDPRTSGAMLRRQLGAHVHGFAGLYACISL
jgi:hypothetical protein